ncbi:MAG: lipoate--protein ligase family protein [Thermaerobacter sp.]|nr:MAG: ligase [Bacillota bacterium]
MEPWRLVMADDRDPFLLDASPVLAETIGEAVARGDAPPTLLLRWQHPHVLLGPADGRLPHLDRAAAWLESVHGLPAYMRISGGSAVLLDETTLSFAVAVPCRDLTRLHDNYQTLLLGLFDALAGLGVAARFGEAPGSYCPGPYDLVLGDGRKIAGVAQALRRGFAEVGGMLLLGQDPVKAVRILEGFYEQAGGPRRFDPASVTSLSAVLGRPVDRREAAEAIIAAYAARVRLEPGELTAAERARARALLEVRRVRARPAVLP